MHVIPIDPYFASFVAALTIYWGGQVISSLFEETFYFFRDFAKHAVNDVEDDLSKIFVEKKIYVK